MPDNCISILCIRMLYVYYHYVSCSGLLRKTKTKIHVLMLLSEKDFSNYFKLICVFHQCVIFSLISTCTLYNMTSIISRTDSYNVVNEDPIDFINIEIVQYDTVNLLIYNACYSKIKMRREYCTLKNTKQNDTTMNIESQIMID